MRSPGNILIFDTVYPIRGGGGEAGAYQLLYSPPPLWPTKPHQRRRAAVEERNKVADGSGRQLT